MNEVFRTTYAVGFDLDGTLYPPNAEIDNRIRNKISERILEKKPEFGNIETARKIGIGRAKMTTLDGDVATIAGAMIGGYREKRRTSAFKEVDVVKSLEDAHELSSELQKESNNLAKQKEDNEHKIVRLKKKRIQGKPGRGHYQIRKSPPFGFLRPRSFQIIQNRTAGKSQND